jgi:NNP family nitrate/nitrite transporter-like MFS transporter
MQLENKATRINLFNFTTPQMRAFHMAWFAFFLCFFAWFGIAPLMPVVRRELSLSQEQVGWCIIASVAITILARLVTGWLCDAFGPRLTYTALLLLGSLPVMGIGLADSFESFLIFRLLIGAIGASFVITQHHTSLMFAPNCVGAANATAAGWGNLGGGVTQAVMPLLFAFLVSVLGLSAYAGWRLSMLLAGLVCFFAGIAYYRLTQDTPQGNFDKLRRTGKLPPRKVAAGAFWEACRDYRVWLLFLIYGACFGVEITIDNIAALYFADYFDLGLTAAGATAAAFGCMNLFARAAGGYIGDRCGWTWGLSGRVWWLFAVLLCEGLALIAFSQVRWLVLAVPMLMLFGLFVKMANGATYAVVPFVNPRALGAVSGIVGAGGNAGAVAAGFLFKDAGSWPISLAILGGAVTTIACVVPAIRFSEQPAPQAVAGTEVVEPAVA